ncbi:hypothetical protein OIU78_016362 [Salix suchowensis]|nr:hypothetical protein OIU78_016362 [Salix suchowensis]
MPSWWGKSSSKELKKKAKKESFIDTLHRRFKSPSDGNLNGRSGGSRRHCSDTILERGSQSRAVSRSSSPSSKHVSRCQSFAERPHAHPLPLPGVHPANVGRTDSGIVRAPLIVMILWTQVTVALQHLTMTLGPEPQLAAHPVQCSTISALLRAIQIQRRQRNQLVFILVPQHGAFCSAPDSSMSSPSRSPMRAFSSEQVINAAFWAGKPYPDANFLGSGHCSSPGSGYNSGHNSMGGDMSGQLFWQQSRGSPECSPIPSPRMTSPGPSSRVQSGAVTPIHPRAGGTIIESQTSWPDDQHLRLCHEVQEGQRIQQAQDLAGKKGKLLGRGTFGHVYLGFNSESGELCAMKEVTLFSDDAKSKESAKQLMQEISLLSRLRHQNIVQYHGSETVGDRLYIYLEYGLHFCILKSTVHRDIKGANILVDPNGRVKLADFGMAKHITGQSCPLSFKGSPYWMAPEVIKNSSGCNLAVDIWSLGCTVLEMATAKPPWSQFEGVAAMFKIGNSKDLPAIPDHLSDEGKDFVRQCLQRNPLHRPTAARLLEHPFVKSAAPLERPILSPEPTDPPSGVTNGVKVMGINQSRNFPTLDSEILVVHSSRVSKTGLLASDLHIPRNISCPVSPIGSPLFHSRSPQHLNGRMSPSPIASPRTTSGSSTPLTGGTGAIPFNHLKQTAYLQEGFGNMPNHANGKQLGRPTQGEPYDGQSVLALRVSRQLLRDHVKMKPSLDLSPNSPLPSQTRAEETSMVNRGKEMWNKFKGEETGWRQIGQRGSKLMHFDKMHARHTKVSEDTHSSQIFRCTEIELAN